MFKYLTTLFLLFLLLQARPTLHHFSHHDNRFSFLNTVTSFQDVSSKVVYSWRLKANLIKITQLNLTIYPCLSFAALKITPGTHSNCCGALCICCGVICKFPIQTQFFVYIEVPLKKISGVPTLIFELVFISL